MIKLINKFCILILFLISSCAFKNEKLVSISIDSYPAGANIYIDGKHYGSTPTMIDIAPKKNYDAIIKKEGYQNVNLELETAYAIRRSKVERKRCILDAMGTMFVIPAFAVYSSQCRDFKNDEYMVNLFKKFDLDDVFSDKVKKSAAVEEGAEESIPEPLEKEEKKIADVKDEETVSSANKEDVEPKITIDKPVQKSPEKKKFKFSSQKKKSAAIVSTPIVTKPAILFTPTPEAASTPVPKSFDSGPKTFKFKQNK